MAKIETVTVKVQRPIFTSGDTTEIMSYIVDEDDNQLSNADISVMPQEHIDQLFGEHYKVYYLAKYRKGKKVQLYKPTRQDDWV